MTRRPEESLVCYGMLWYGMLQQHSDVVQFTENTCLCLSPLSHILSQPPLIVSYLASPPRLTTPSRRACHSFHFTSPLPSSLHPSFSSPLLSSPHFTAPLSSPLHTSRVTLLFKGRLCMSGRARALACTIRILPGH
jgi:hypothetical protein